MSLALSKTNKVLVMDTGPILALARIDKLDLLFKLFEQCWITESVLSECLAKPERIDASRVRQALVNEAFLPALDPKVRSSLCSIDAGEQTAIEFALQKDCFLLIDEKRGRVLAKAEGALIIGTIGILLLAKDKHLIQAAKPHLLKLVKTGYHIADDLFLHALELAGE